MRRQRTKQRQVVLASEEDNRLGGAAQLMKVTVCIRPAPSFEGIGAGAERDVVVWGHESGGDEPPGERVDVGLPRQIEDDLPQFGREWRQSIAGLGLRYRDGVRLHRILGRRHLGLAVRLFRKGPATSKLPNRMGLRPT